MEQFGTAVSILGPAVFLSMLAWWKQNAILFLLTGAAAIVAGLSWRPEFPDVAGLTNGLVLVAYGIFCLGYALKLVVWGKDE